MEINVACVCTIVRVHWIEIHVACARVMLITSASVVFIDG